MRRLSLRNWIIVSVVGSFIIGSLVCFNNLNNIVKLQNNYDLNKKLDSILIKKNISDTNKPKISVFENEVHLDGGNIKAREELENYLRKEYIVKDVRNLDEFNSKIIIFKKGM